MLKSWSRYLVLGYFPFATVSIAADLFSGDFTGRLDGKVCQLSIAGYTGGQYEGRYQVAGEIMPLHARRFGDRLAGQIGSADFKFGFMPQVQAGGLLLRDENGRGLRFRRIQRSPTGND